VSRTTNNAKDSEAGVESSVGPVDGGVVELTTTTEAGERIEHAGTAETHQAYQENLCQRGVVAKEPVLGRFRWQPFHLHHHLMLCDVHIISHNLELMS
jgi:hypothetical protein